MIARLARAWLFLASAFSFSAFGLGSILLAFTVVPACRLYPGSPAAKDLRVQRCVHWSFRGLLGLWWLLGLTTVRLRDVARLRAAGPCIIAPNHPSLIDVVVLIAALPQADCIVKRGLWESRFLGGVVRGAGYIPNDSHEVLLPACAERLAAGRKLILFPEGTRSPPGTLGSFMRGAAHVSLLSGRPIVPVVITCKPPELGTSSTWYHTIKHRMHFTVTVLEPLAPDADGAGSPGRQVATARSLTETLRNRIKKELERAD